MIKNDLNEWLTSEDAIPTIYGAIWTVKDSDREVIGQKEGDEMREVVTSILKANTEVRRLCFAMTSVDERPEEEVLTAKVDDDLLSLRGPLEISTNTGDHWKIPLKTDFQGELPTYKVLIRTSSHFKGGYRAIYIDEESPKTAAKRVLADLLSCEVEVVEVNRGDETRLVVQASCVSSMIENEEPLPSYVEVSTRRSEETSHDFVVWEYTDNGHRRVIARSVPKAGL